MIDFGKGAACVLAAALMISVAACSKNNGEAAAPAPTPEETAAAAPAPAPAPTPAPEPTGPTVVGDKTCGEASWYGNELAGNKTANGEVFDPSKLTAAHRTIAFGTKLKVTFEKTGQSVVVVINDRGPFAKDRIIDLSQAAAAAIGLERAGVGQVCFQEVQGA